VKPSLHNKYFGWLILLMLIIYTLIFTVFFAIEFHESRTQGTPLSKEYPEFLAMFVVMLFTTPAAVVIAWNIAGRLLNPLRKVLATAEQIRQGNLETRIPRLPHHDEISKLADTINDAFDRYAYAVNQVENFSTDASHQLRTPLAAIKTAAEVTLQKERRPGEYQEALGDILEQTEKLNQMIGQLLLLSRIDHRVRDAMTPIDLAASLQSWVSESEELFDDRSIRFETTVSGNEGVVPGNAVLLKEAFNNLINNALAFVPVGGHVLIRLSATGSAGVEWRVEDSGPGIPAVDRERVFDRFYRGSQSGHAGSGLGLAIVREIIQLHGGTIRVESSASLGGAAFVITLPGA